MQTYAGQPITMATTARIVSPFPYPSALYIAGANRGNPKPAIDRRHAAAARAEYKYKMLSRCDGKEMKNNT